MKTIVPFFFVFLFVLFSACNQKAKTIPKKEQQQEVLKDTVSPKVNSHESETKEEIDLTSKLEEKVARLAQLKYNYQLKKLEKVTPAKSHLFSRLIYVSIVKKNSFKTIDSTAVQNDIYEIRTSFLKGTKPMQRNGNTYPRVTVEEYLFKSNELATNFYKALLHYKKEDPDWNFIAKEPHALFLEKNRIYFVSSGGHYMMEIYKDIVEKIKG